MNIQPHAEWLSTMTATTPNISDQQAPIASRLRSFNNHISSST